MMSFRRWASGAVAATLLSLAAMPADAAPGGRIERRDTPIRRLDTRLDQGGDGRVTSIEVGAGALQVWVLRPAEVGTAVLHPCDEPAPTDRVTFRLDPAQPTQHTRTFAPGAMCLTSTTPAQVIVDDLGTVAASSLAAGEQYVALPQPITLSTQTITNSAPAALARPASLTTEATAAVVSVEMLHTFGTGFVTVYACDEAIPVRPDLDYARGRVANVSVVPIGPGQDLCVYSSSEVTLRTSLLGELRTEGPTLNALPPSWSFVPGPVPAASLRSFNPVRRLDTRIGVGRPGTERLAANETLELALGDLAGPLTTAVSMNVTATAATDGGFLTVWPCTETRPLASNLNFPSGEAVPNLVVSSLSADDSVCLASSSDAHVIVDVNGTYEADGGLGAVAVEPVRILDTRTALGTAISGRVAAGNEIELTITGDDVAATAGAATLNVTAVGASQSGFVTVYPCDAPRPTASNLNFRAGQATPNLVTTSLSATGTVCLYASQAVHLIADLAAWYALDEPAGLVELAPTRVLDTRAPTGVATAGRVAANRVLDLDVTSTPGVTDGAVAVVMNVTSAQAFGAGYVTAWPCDQTKPTVSNLNIDTGRTVANLTTVKVSASGRVCLSSTVSTHLIADVAGYLTDAPVDGDALVLLP